MSECTKQKKKKQLIEHCSYVHSQVPVPHGHACVGGGKEGYTCITQGLYSSSFKPWRIIVVASLGRFGAAYLHGNEMHHRERETWWGKRGRRNLSRLQQGPLDKVDHMKILHKLDGIGLCSQVTCWVQSLLTGRSQTVVVDGYESSSCPVTSGVPHGSVIGPILFLVYINNLPDWVLSKTRLLADNTVIYNTSENSQHVQDDLNALQSWETSWEMEINPLMCEYVKFSRKRTKGAENQYILHNVQIPKADGVKYLGVKLESSLRLNNNTTYITN